MGPGNNNPPGAADAGSGRPAAGAAVRRLGWGVVIAFTIKGVATTGLIAFGFFKAAGLL